MTDAKKQKIGFSSGLLVLCLFILCQPNVNILDIFPDFIAYFILAGMMGSAAAFVPYMDEARSTFYKLALFDIFRFFCQFLIFASANNDTRNDTMALFSLSFSVVGYILLFKAIRDTFSALFYLGERSACASLIRPFRVLGAEVRPEHLEFCLLGFFGLKALLSMLPDFIRLFSKNSTFLLYRNSVFACVILGFISAAIILVLACCYIHSVRSEARFRESLSTLSLANAAPAQEHNQRQILSTAFLFMFASTIFTFFLPMDTFGYADLFPGFLFPVFFLIGLGRLRSLYPIRKSLFRVGLSLSVVSFASFVLRPVFFYDYDLSDITKIGTAKSLYAVYEGVAIAECILTAAFLLLLRRFFDNLIENRTGVPVTAKDYRETDRDYHRSIKKLNRAATVFGIITLLARTAKILTDSHSQTSAILRDSVIVGSVTMSAFPWLGMVVNVTAVLYAVLFYYFSSTLKDEWNV